MIKRFAYTLTAAIALTAPAHALAAMQCEAVFALKDEVVVGVLQFAVGYPYPEIEFDRRGGTADCTSLTGALPTIQDDREGTMSASFIDFSGIRGPRPLMACAFDAAYFPSAADFEVAVTNAAAPSTEQLVPPPGVVVAEIHCEDSPSSTTTTTIPDEDTACLVGAGLAQSLPASSVAFEVRAVGSAGTVVGLVTDAACESTSASVEVEFFVKNTGVSVTLAGGQGLPGQAQLAACTLTGSALAAADFVAEVTEVTAQDGTSFPPEAVPLVVNVDCFPLATTTTFGAWDSTTTTSSTSTSSTVSSTSTSSTVYSTSTSTSTSTVPTTTLPYCGDGIVSGEEQCDDGDSTQLPGDSCTAECTQVACGDADASSFITASDALFALRIVVGMASCAPCVCDVDASGGQVSASDALQMLRVAVGLQQQLTCPSCLAE